MHWPFFLLDLRGYFLSCVSDFPIIADFFHIWWYTSDSIQWNSGIVPLLWGCTHQCRYVRPVRQIPGDLPRDIRQTKYQGNHIPLFYRGRDDPYHILFCRLPVSDCNEWKRVSVPEHQFLGWYWFHIVRPFAGSCGILLWCRNHLWMWVPENGRFPIWRRRMFCSSHYRKTQRNHYHSDVFAVHSFYRTREFLRNPANSPLWKISWLRQSSVRGEHTADNPMLFLSWVQKAGYGSFATVCEFPRILLLRWRLRWLHGCVYPVHSFLLPMMKAIFSLTDR